MNKSKWEPVTVEERGRTWIDLVWRDFVISQGYSEREATYSLFRRGRFVSDFTKIRDAKEAAEKLEEPGEPEYKLAASGGG